MHRLRFTGKADEARFDAAVSRNPWWYHTFLFDNGFEVRGYYDIGKNVHEYGFSDDLSGMKVLDIGPASGWFSFYFEQLGAEVTTVDVRGSFDLDLFGSYQYAPGDESTGAYRPADSPFGVEFQTMHELLDSNVRVRTGRAYEVGPELLGGETFDLVFMGALLMHLRDPIGALRAARSVCRGKAIVTNWLTLEEGGGHPWAELPALGRDEPFAWWRPNRACYGLWFEAAGFDDVDVHRSVTLTADKPRLKDHKPEPVNPTQVLGLAHAYV